MAFPSYLIQLFPNSEIRERVYHEIMQSFITTPSYGEPYVFALQGPGNNGKTAFLRILSQWMGKKVVVVPEVSQFAKAHEAVANLNIPIFVEIRDSSELAYLPNDTEVFPMTSRFVAADAVDEANHAYLANPDIVENMCGILTSA